jgi:hypothetical protein
LSGVPAQELVVVPQKSRVLDSKIHCHQRVANRFANRFANQVGKIAPNGGTERRCNRSIDAKERTA